MKPASKFRDFQPGTRVRLSGKFLRSTGQIAGGEGSKVWVVMDAPCSERLVAVNEERSCPEDFTPEEYAADPSLKWRRIAKANLTVVGQLDSRDDP